ncbi:hypothetical protein HPB47_006744 [Ixodes persulcatus]|uniref:Uncharacterized protein n=1 Tax=Ixodes persulcatus TaxID=34615 RepID=A0AC60P9A8_IXOPE|nr:hypothetical protein HPB47_006744 [Ixodes persulcatus]
MACESGDYTEDGVPYITVVVDGGWAHRSYGHRYTSSSGVAVIIGSRTKKILYLSVRNKYCSTCNFYMSKNETPRNHACFKNWDGPSTAMESDIIAEGFRKSREMHGLEYRRVVGDGDSNVEKALKTSVDYGRMITKVACVNHVIKNYTKSLYAIRSSGQSHAKHLTNVKIGRLAAAAKGAVSASHALKQTTQELASSLRNGPRHVFGTHNNCSPHYCQQHQQQASTTFEDLPYTLQTDLMRTANNLAD